MDSQGPNTDMTSVVESSPTAQDTETNVTNLPPIIIDLDPESEPSPGKENTTLESPTDKNPKTVIDLETEASPAQTSEAPPPSTQNNPEVIAKETTGQPATTLVTNTTQASLSDKDSPLNTTAPSDTPSNVRTINELSGGSEDSNEPNSKRIKRQHHLQVGRSYENLAKKYGWKNSDGSTFPVQVEGICKYMRFKANTSNPRSVGWYVAALKKYHHEVLGIDRWDDILKHPLVKKLTAEIEEEAAAKNMREASALLQNAKTGSTLTGKDREKHALAATSSQNVSIAPAPPYNWASATASSDIQSRLASKLSASGLISPNRTFPPQYDLENRPAEAVLAMLGIEPVAEDADSYEGTETTQLQPQSQPQASSQPPVVISIDDSDDEQVAQEPAVAGPSRPTAPLRSRRPRRTLQYTEPDEDDDFDYTPPRMTTETHQYVPSRRRRNRELDMILQETDLNEPESFKYRYDCALAMLRSKYIGHCSKHPRGCFTIDAHRHLVLNDIMMRHWAALVASGDDVTVEKVPDFPEMPEFHESKAIKVQQP